MKEQHKQSLCNSDSFIWNSGGWLIRTWAAELEGQVWSLAYTSQWSCLCGGHKYWVVSGAAWGPAPVFTAASIQNESTGPRASHKQQRKALQSAQPSPARKCCVIAADRTRAPETAHVPFWPLIPSPLCTPDTNSAESYMGRVLFVSLITVCSTAHSSFIAVSRSISLQPSEGLRGSWPGMFCSVPQSVSIASSANDYCSLLCLLKYCYIYVFSREQ